MTRRVLIVLAVPPLLCAGCRDSAAPPRTPASPAPTAAAPRALTAVLVRGQTAAGRTRITYRPARVEHVTGDGYETLRVTPTGPPVTRPLSDRPAVLLCTPLNPRRHFGVTKPEPVPVRVLVTALARDRRLLPDIGFDMRIDASGRISYLKEYYRP